MIKKILNTLDDFLDTDQSKLTIFPNEQLNEHINRFDAAFNGTYLSKFEKVFKEKKINEKTSLIDLGTSIKEIYENFSKEERENFILEIFNYFLNNFKSVFYLMPNFEKDLYEKTNPLLKSYYKIYSEIFIKVIDTYIEMENIKTELDEKISSINIIYSELNKLESNNNISLIDLFTYDKKIVKQIIEVNEFKFKRIFRDILLNFSNILEGEFKKLLYILDLFLKTENGESINYHRDNIPMFGQILSNIDGNRKLQNLRQLKEIRNSISHDKYDINFRSKFEDISIRFDVLHGKPINLKVSELLILFEKIFRTINTLQLMLLIIYIENMGNIKPVEFLNFLKKNDTSQNNDTTLNQF